MRKSSSPARRSPRRQASSSAMSSALGFNLLSPTPEDTRNSPLSGGVRPSRSENEGGECGSKIWVGQSQGGWGLPRADMDTTQPTLAFIPARHYASLLDLLVERGHSRDAVLASVGLHPESFAREAGYLSLQQMEDLVERACSLEPGREIGLDVGARISLMSHGSVSVAALSAANLGEAIEVIAEYFA